MAQRLNSPGAGFHACPRKGCHQNVPNARYACPRDWAELGSETKKEITRTRNRNVLDPERRAAFRMADIDWNQ